MVYIFLSSDCITIYPITVCLFCFADNELKNFSPSLHNFNQISQVFKIRNIENSKEIEKFDSSQNSLHHCSTCGRYFLSTQKLNFWILRYVYAILIFR